MACSFDLIKYDNFNGDFDKYYNTIVEIFNNTFSKQHYLFGKSIKDNDRLWHIISDGKEEDSRLINFTRAQYINLLISMLTQQECKSSCGKFHYYEKLHQKSGKRSIRAYLYCPTYRYLIVLEKKNYIYGVITAFPVDTNHKHNKILEDIELYNKKREPI